MIDTTTEISQVIVDGVSVPVAQGEQMKVQTFDLPFEFVSGSDETFYTVFRITDLTLISDIKTLLSEKRDNNKLISFSLKFVGIEAPYIVSAINSPLFFDNVGFISYVSSGSVINPIYYILGLYSNSLLEVYHQNIPTANIQEIFSGITSFQAVVKYME